MIRCVLFDLDGTLLDTAPDLGHALNLLRGEEGLPPLPESIIRPVASNGARGLLLLAFGLNPDDGRFEPLRRRYLSLYHEHIVRETRPFAGIEPVLHELTARQLPWGIVTNKPRWLTEPLLAGMRFPSPPRCVVSGDSASHPKPHPAPLHLACGQAGFAPSECVYVGDAGRDIESGRRAGTYTVAAAYGYIESGDDPCQWGADGVIERPDDLIVWLDGRAQGVRARDGRHYLQL